jgi:hypothetical protein
MSGRARQPHGLGEDVDLLCLAGRRKRIHEPAALRLLGAYPLFTYSSQTGGLTVKFADRTTVVRCRYELGTISERDVGLADFHHGGG